MTLKTRLSVLLLSTPVLAFVVVGGLMGNASARAGDDTLRVLKVFEDVVQLVLSNYVEEVKVDRAMEGALKGLADGLDPDSAYLNPQQVADVQAGAPLPEGDVGLELTRQYYLRVISARDGSPAAKAGLQTGDYVRGIDGKPTREMSVFEGTRLLHGQPGSKVTLTIIRGNAADPHEIPLVREKPAGAIVSGRLISLAPKTSALAPPVQQRVRVLGADQPAMPPDLVDSPPLLTTETGYVRIASFRNGAVEALSKQIADLRKAGAKSLVIDIRRTAEGPFENGIAAARLFVKSGMLAQQGGRLQKDAPVEFAAKPGDGAIEVPVQLLVSTGTSGAAEVFAAALKGNKRADLVGEHTLGRAGIQKLVKLPENRGLWLTYSRYLTPSGEAIHGKGIQPTAEVDDVDVVEFGGTPSDNDPILDAALDRLRKKAA
jgi:carboxyl-terminal processing protease